MKKRASEVEYAETRDYLWQTILKQKTFTIGSLQSDGVKLERSSIQQYLRALCRAGYINFQEQGEWKENIYTLLKPVSEPPRVRPDGSQVTQGRGRQNMWRTMRIRKVFTLNDIVALASNEEHAVAEEEAETYIRYLEKAGYIKNTDGKSRPKATFRLIRDTGPKAPMIQRVRQVYDQNLREVVWPK